MELEDAIEEAEEKGWSETLVYHEIFNILRKKKFNTDEEVSKLYALNLWYMKPLLVAAEIKFDV